jgi:hypothetical protein
MMAIARDRLRPAVSYDADVYSWALEQAALLRQGRLAEADVGNIVEELEGLARSEARELRHRYETLVQHLLKWLFQPAARSRGWVATIRRERREIVKHLRDNPGLKPRRTAIFADAYDTALARASGETGLPEERFPGVCPFTLEQAMDEGFWPGEPWAELAAASRTSDRPAD